MAALAAVLLIAAASSTSAFCPPKVTIDSVTYGGTGCNWQNTNYVFSPDYSTVTFIFGGMVATTDGGLANTRKFCQLSFALKYPKGWIFTLGKATGRGFAAIGKHSLGVYESSYYFSGQTGTCTISRKFYGPQSKSFEATDNFLTMVWSQCNGVPNLNIKTVVRVQGGKAAMFLDSHDTKFRLAFGILWKKC
uniref:NADH:ubiquinone oxidoreductase intermediate-associated protein 30 domain-containing protein n=1 Tax=Chara braunii TaxID=69332 RepID=A0A388LFU6_CHABU